MQHSLSRTGPIEPFRCKLSEFFQLLRSEYDSSCVDGSSLLVQPEHKFCSDPEIPTATSDSEEEVGVFAVASDKDAAVGGNDSCLAWGEILK